MFSSKIHEQTILEISQGDYINVLVESFLRDFLKTFIEYCNINSLNFIQEISPDFTRRSLLAFSETHNPGGVHRAYRTLRAFFHWLIKVKAPKVSLDPLEPISMEEDIRALINTCQRGIL